MTKMMRSSYNMIKLTRFRMFKFKKKLTLRSILVILLLNIVISVLILHRHTKVDVVLNIYYNKNPTDIIEYRPLLTTLTAYRLLYIQAQKQRRYDVNLNLVTESSAKSIQADDESLEWLKTIRQNEAESNLADNSKLKDYLFNRNAFITDMDHLSSRLDDKESYAIIDLESRFYQPRILIGNEKACSSRKNKIFIVCMIHSHRNNFIRRKTMRDTWLSQNKINILDLVEKTNRKIRSEDLEMVHLFIIGSAAGNDGQRGANNQTEASYKSLIEESEHFKDIILIDTVDNYKNLIYKHLTAVNWMIEHCPQALYMVKLDDDVFVNIKPLSKHLVSKFGQKPIDSKFIYCSIVDKGRPMRHDTSKWQVGYDTYPFKYYPRYCEGFSYITNMATVQLMHQQAKIIPRFWIDDVYFTGLLLHGFNQIDWYNYRPVLKWSFYDFWDLGNGNNMLLTIYASMLKVFNVKAVDYYKTDFFVILHVQKSSNEVNYELVADNSTQEMAHPQTQSMPTQETRIDKSVRNICMNFNFFSMKNSTSLFNEISRCYKNEKYSFHFYNFCTQLWNDS